MHLPQAAQQATAGVSHPRGQLMPSGCLASAHSRGPAGFQASHGGHGEEEAEERVRVPALPLAKMVY